MRGVLSGGFLGCYELHSCSCTFLLGLRALKRTGIVVTDDLGMPELASRVGIDIWHGPELMKKMPSDQPKLLAAFKTILFSNPCHPAP